MPRLFARRWMFAPTLAALLGAPAMADLQGRYFTADTSHGFDAFYDTQLNVTWLADAAYGGRMNWDDIENWLPTVNLGGHRDWRLPTYQSPSGGPGELYTLWVFELGNNSDPQHPTMSYNPGPFHNVKYYISTGYDSCAYWTSYSYGDFAMAWMTFNAFYIGQYRNGLSYPYYMWLCRTGDTGWGCTGGPSIVTQPAPSSACSPGRGDSVFTTSATGSGTVSYRWQVDNPFNPGTWANLSDGALYLGDGSLGATLTGSASATLTVTPLANLDLFFRCTATDSCGGAVSDVAWMHVGPTCDFNMDGAADLSDVFDLADAIASGTDPNPGCKDFNQDGSEDTGDVLDLADAVASGTCP